MQPADYARITVVSDVRLSPDGRTVAYTSTGFDLDADRSVPSVRVVATEGSTPSRPFTREGRASAPRFSPDGRWLAFLRATDAGFLLCVAPMDGGEAAVVAGPYSLLTGPVWSPDSMRLAFAARPGAAPVGSQPKVVSHLANRQDGQGWWTGPSDVFVADRDGGDVCAVTDGTADHDQPAWSPDGSTIALVADREPGHRDRVYRGDIWLADVTTWDGRAPAVLTRVTAAGGVAYEPTWSPDGSRIAFLGNDAGDALWWTPVELRVADAATGEIRSLTADWDGSTGARGAVEGRQLQWTADGSTLWFVAAVRGGNVLHRVGAAGGVVEQVLHGPRHVAGFAVADRGDRLYYCERSADALPTVASLDLANGHEHVLDDPNEELVSSLDVPPLERFTVAAADGVEVEAFLLRPRGDGPFPLLLDVHGGPHGWHPSSSLRMLCLYKCAVARGYAVLLPNPRGSGGYGAAFLQAVVGDWGGADLHDILATVDHVVAEGVADPDRLHVHGYSYGGFMTAWIIGREHRFRSAAIGAPVADQPSMALTTDIGAFTVGEVGGDPWRDHVTYRERSPVAMLHEARTPAFVYANEGDLRCPVDQAVQVFTALRLAGVPCTLARYPGGSHSLATPSQVIDQISRILDHAEVHDLPE